MSADFSMPAIDGLIPLQLMSPGQRGEVDHIVGRADDVHRLQEIGLRDGTRIEMVQSGNPCIVRLEGHALCFRADDLMRVLVRTGD